MKKHILILAVAVMPATLLQAQSWDLQGNTGTNPATDFVGTTDNTPLLFRVNNTQCGKISASDQSIIMGPTSGLVSTGSSNSFYGSFAGRFTTTGNTNTFVGANTGMQNISGNANCYFGLSAGSSGTTGSGNCFFGHSAGQANTASNNCFFGLSSGVNNSSGFQNCFFGAFAGGANTTGPNNTFIGFGCGQVNTGGSDNVFLGKSAGQNNTVGSSNVFVGSLCGTANTFGIRNIFIGAQAAGANTSGASNITIGTASMHANTTGNFNVSLGDSSGLVNSTGSQNTFLGYKTGASAGNFTNATAIGANATVGASNSVVLGNNANVGIGVSAPLDALHVAGNIRMVDGSQAAGKVLTSDANGKATWQVIPPTPPGGAAGGDLGGTYPNPSVDAIQGTAVSAAAPTTGQVLQYNGTSWTPITLPAESSDWKITGNTGTSASTNFIGNKDNVALTFRVNDTLAGLLNQHQRNVFLGYKAGFSNIVHTGNTFIGDRAGTSNVTSNNTFIGKESGTVNTTGTQNTFVGGMTGSSNTTGNQNCIFGFNAGKNTTGSSNTILGESAAFALTSGGENVMVGKSAASALTSGDNNVIIGQGAASSLTSGSSNTVIGENALTGLSRTNGIVIGSGAAVTLDNCAVIGNASLTKIGIGKTPTASNILEFQATTAKLTTGGVWTNASDRKIKDNITQLNKQEILDKVNQLEVSRWHYKADEQPVTHIGPFAKEFYQAFGTGDDYTISTIDPSGVALVAIQALSEKLEKLEAENASLKDCIQQICSQTEVPATDKKSAEELNADVLYQNTPNPFSEKTTIRYRISSLFSSARMIIRNLDGQVISEEKIATGGLNEITISGNFLHSGTYTYTLEVDGRSIDTKLMVITK